jgi:drug/metabolite transporter (DMT)-like permease
MQGTNTNQEPLALAAFLTSSVLAGGNAVAIRYSNRELAPLWGAGLRFSLAASILIIVMAVLRLPIPSGRALAGALLYGVFNFGASFALAYYALVRMQAGVGQTLLALVPLATLLLAVLYRQERLRLGAIVGTLVAFAGIALATSASLQQSVPLLSVLAVLGSVLCFAQAAIIVRRFPMVHPVTMNAIGMTAAATLLVVASALAGNSFVLPQRATTWVAIGYLVPIGSVIVFLLYLVVLRHWTASRAAYSFVIIPFVTVLLSAWLDNERVGGGLVVGGLLVLAGVYIGALRRTPATLSPVSPSQS